MIRAIVVDDEQLAIRHLVNKLNKTGKVDVVGTFSNAHDFLKEIKSLDVHVVFSDIEMPGFSGLELAELINDSNSDIFIVFVTAYRDYAVQAFDMQSIDYLLKPIMSDRLDKTITRIEDQLEIRAVRKQSAPSQCALQIFCFNEFTVYHHGVPVKWKTVKVKELFAYFITNLHTPVHRDTIIEHLWEEVDYQKAKVQLHTAISYLRKTLASIGHPNAVHFSDGSYHLEIDHFLCDAHQFEQLLQEHPQVTDENIELIEDIIQQYTGDYMEKNGYEWAQSIAHSHRQNLLHVLQMIIDYFSERELLNKQQHYLQLLVSLNPYSEHAIQQLMRFHVETGNRVEAVKVFREMKTLLVDDLGISPDQSTIDLYDSILKG